MNSGQSVSRLKGPSRPINDEITRTHLLASLLFVDAVVIFEQDTPLELIRLIQPDVLVKGGDWKPEQIVGSDIVLSRGGQVYSLPFVDGYSTTGIERRIREGGC
jgi:rfaE bifunctional protein nucleotidyltransferase chain/domain